KHIVNNYGVRHCYIPPGMCNAQADVESIHSTIEKEFFDITQFKSRLDFFDKVESYRLFYNTTRPNYSKKGFTPWMITQNDWSQCDLAILN
ncbi:integrase core domain-containing protein, partial [Chlamydiales bacterium]|nr:integrase core domain-containing protein [Chlamydiales bacterium]